MRRFFLGAALAALLASPAAAIDPDEMFEDPALEARTVELSKLLRCLVCQNQSIYDSNAGLARDLRDVVRERIRAGDSNDQALTYIVERYGDYVLLEPPVKGTTAVLWAAPWAFLAAALAVAVVYLRRRAAPAAAEDDVAAGRRLLTEDDA